jgi:rhamnose utilization protein RhaD (predicted bifunctional aldolase and dehydrogenase)
LTEGTNWRPADDLATHAAATDPVSAALAVRGSYYPDHVIFLGPAALALEPHESIEDGLQRYRLQGRPLSPLILVPGRGALLRRDATPGAVALARCLSDVMSRLSARDELTMLTETQEAELMGWDAEAYRRALDAQ